MKVSRFCPVFPGQGGGGGEGRNMCAEETAFGTNVAVLSLIFV